MVASHSLWLSRFGGQPDVLGKTIKANGRQFTIIGVMPPHFQFPGGARPTFWVPVENSQPREEGANIKVFARLEPGVTVTRTQAMLDMLAQQLLRDKPEVYDSEWRRRGGGFGLSIRPLRYEFTQERYGAADMQHTLWGLLAAIGFVLIIACVNVANLLLARTERRQHELVIRAAVGASRARLVRQLFTESVLLAGCGALAGLALTRWAMQVMIFLIPENMPRLRTIHMDAHVLGFTLIVSVGTALAFGLAPALLASRASLGGMLKQAGSGTTSSSSWRRYSNTLVIVEVALSVLLLAGAGLMIESVIRRLRKNPGYDADNLLVAHPGLLRGNKYASSDRTTTIHGALFDEMHERFAALPGVKAVGIAKLDFFELGFQVEGQEKPLGLQRAGTGVGASDIFRAMHIPLRSGRYLDKTDIGEHAGTVIVNETMARLCWPGQDALNKTFRDKDGRSYQVIGLIGDARIGLRERSVDPVEPMFFRPYYEQANTGGYGPFFVLRTESDPRSLIPAVRDVIKSVERSMTTPWFEVARETLYNATEAQRTYMLYLIVFALVGLSLAALGIYGVLSCSVGRRTREIGIRIAMGAQPRDVLGMVLLEGGHLVAAGTALGLITSFWLTRLLRHQLFEVSPTDPGVFLIVIVFLLGVALLACLVPARRAVRVNPMESLRHE
jgi:predicted permease